MNTRPGDISDRRVLYLKAALLLLVGVMSGGLLLMERPTLRTAALLACAIWAFCRAYYFAFYVVQHYADPTYRYAGLIDFARYCCRRRKQDTRGGDS